MKRHAVRLMSVAIAVAGSLASARQHDLPHEVLDAAAFRQLVPVCKDAAEATAVVQA